MRSNRKHTTEELERYIQFYLEEGKSYRELKKDYGLLLAETTFGQNVLRYLEHGMSGIQSQAKIILTAEPSRKRLSRSTCKKE